MKFLRSMKRTDQVIALISVFIAVFSILLVYPAVRAAFYPVLACLPGNNKVSLHPYSLVFSTEETPVFIAACERGQFYEFELYPKEALLENERDNHASLDRLSPVPVSFLKNFKDRKLPPQVNFKQSGIFIPLDERHAEARVIVSPELSPGDYLGVLKSRSCLGELLDPLFIPFRVTNIGAVVKIDEQKIVLVVFDLISHEIVRDVNVDCYLRSLDDDNMLTHLFSENSGRTGLINLDLPSSLENEPDFKKRLVLNFRKGEHAAFWGDTKSGESLFDSPWLSTFDLPEEKNRTFLNVNTEGGVINIFGQVVVLTDKGISIPQKSLDLKLEVVRLDRKVLLNEKIKTDSNGLFVAKFKPVLESQGEVFNLILRGDNFETEYFDIIDWEIAKGFVLTDKASKDYVLSSSGDNWVKELDKRAPKVSFDRRSVRPHEKIKASVELPEKNSLRYLLASLEGDRIYQSQLIPVRKNPLQLEFEFNETPWPNLYLSLSSLGKEHSPFTTTRNVFLSKEDKELVCELKTDITEFKPGEPLKLKLSVKDHDGMPVSQARVIASIASRKEVKAVHKLQHGQAILSILHKPFLNKVVTVFTFNQNIKQEFTRYKTINLFEKIEELRFRMAGRPKTQSDFKPIGQISTLPFASNQSSVKLSNLPGDYILATTNDKGEAQLELIAPREREDCLLTIYSIASGAKCGSLEKSIKLKSSNPE